MYFAYGVMIGVSSIIMGSIAVYAIINRKVSGAFPLFIQMTVAVIWMISSLMEISVTTIEAKIYWRNFQQIGTFIMPISNIFFAVDYTRNIKFKKYANYLSIIPITALILIFTDEHHHIMRLGYVLAVNNWGNISLVVNSTLIGTIFVEFNYIFQGVAILILLDFARRVSGRFRKQVYMVIVSILLTFFLAWFNVVHFKDKGIYIPIAVLYMPSGIILFYSVFRYKLFNISPIARDKVFDIIKECIIVIDYEGNIVDANDYAVNMLNKLMLIQYDVIGAKIENVFKNAPKILEMINAYQEYSEDIHINVGQTSYYLSVGIYPLSVSGEKDKVGSILIINDITQHKNYELGLKLRADIDGLTGLLNKNSFSDLFMRLLQSGEAAQQLITVFMIDIDLFKNINDTYGHIIGDKVLQHFAQMLKGTLRPEDVIGRIGGEEFAVILPNINKLNAYIIAERIRKRVEASKFLTVNDERVKYTVSIGIADNENLYISQEELLYRADMALYEAKKNSRNCTMIGV